MELDVMNVRSNSLEEILDQATKRILEVVNLKATRDLTIYLRFLDGTVSLEIDNEEYLVRQP